MDVKYIPSDWDKMKDGIGDLIGLGRWGKGMIDTLKDLSDNLEDAESDIADHDSDGVISFHYTSQKDRYQGLYEDFEILHSFTGKVGDIVDRTIDQPFYEDMDAFVEAMRDLSISNYTTTNRLGVTETQFVYGGYGTAQSFEVPKTEVSLDDLFSGDNFYAGQMKLEYDAWKELNPDQDLSQVEYQQAALNTRAFEYDSIRNQQEDKEFWGQIGALVVIVGATIICPPAGLALGAAYGAMELSSAVSGKDWISGRELGTGERWFRGLLAPLDIVPGVSGLTKFSSTVRLAHLGENIGGIGLRTGVKQSFSQGINHIDNMVRTAGQQSVTRLKSASAAIKDGTNVVKNKLAKDTIEIGKLTDTVIAGTKNRIPSQERLVVTGTSEKDYIPVDNNHVVESSLRNVLSRIHGLNIEGVRGTGEVINPNLSKNSLEELQSFQSSSVYTDLLAEHNITETELHVLVMSNVNHLTDAEKVVLRSFRDAVPAPTNNTILQKVISIEDINNYLRDVDPYTTIGGCIAKAEDVKHLSSASEIFDGLRLDYPGTKFGKNVDYAVIRFKTNEASKLEIPYSNKISDTENGKSFISYPQTGNGFTSARDGSLIPEYEASGYMEPQHGAELYKVVNGEETLIGVYDGTLERFKKIIN